ncbi:hypothetical protein EDD18DRAFT_1097517 [Armillaria luteobubalina]|uniref:Uncharacterized protein n=1 Tax=Armillaria luteobubalina TaxID=153913 RepID=A0AA39QQL7_9AGAR|nr:hypothetical protein EDD18DRAFT_1097517 [Armillaria luteobubalina]
MSFSETHLDLQYPYDAPGIYASSSDSDGPRTPSYPSPSSGAEAYSYSPVEFYPKTEGSAPYWSTPYTQIPDVALPTDVPLHAPVPLPRQSSLLYPDAQTGSYPIHDAPTQPGPLFGYPSQPLVSPVSPLESFPEPSNSKPVPLQPLVPLETPPFEPFVNFYNTNPCDLPLLTFPTPSELLNDQPSAVPDAHDSGSDKADTARRARSRAMAKSVGFTPTDPDSISSHEKKRHYLECLERYVIYLHEQLKPHWDSTRCSGTSFQLSRSQQPFYTDAACAYEKYDAKSQPPTHDGGFLSLRDALIKQEATAEALKQCQPRSTDPGATEYVNVNNGSGNV